jgi:hypothetical protein
LAQNIRRYFIHPLDLDN